MTKRLQTICSHLGPADVFADVGCDHGYCTQYMFEQGLCRKAYISDISAGSLKKAAALLKVEVEAGRCIPVVADGLEGIKEPCDLVLIAGLGGEEIVHILSGRPLPKRFVLQPMKNSDKVRAKLIEWGAKIECDYTFEDEKFYDLIVGESGGREEYSELEIRFGRDNLKNPSPAFLGRLEHDAMRLREALERPIGVRREEVEARLCEIESVRNAIK